MIMFSGALATSLGAIAFGFLYYTDYPKTFIGFSFALRILQGLGFAAFNTAAFTYMANRFPEHISILMVSLPFIRSTQAGNTEYVPLSFEYVPHTSCAHWVCSAYKLKTNSVSQHILKRERNILSATGLGYPASEATHYQPE